jgi:hypothetical protein
MSVGCVALFVIDKMPCGMLRVRWCDIVLMAYFSTEGKTGLFFHFVSAIRKFPLNNVMQNWK